MAKSGGKGPLNKEDDQLSKLDPTRRDRKTTMPVLDGPQDPQRPAAGPPAQPFKDLNKAAMQNDDSALQLQGDVEPDQLAEDRAEWFLEGEIYVDRVATMHELCPTLFTNIPYDETALRARLDRCKATDQYVATQRARLNLIEQTNTVERADLMRMCDVSVEEASLQYRRPTLTPAQRNQLKKALALPLSIWNARLQRIKQRRDANQTSQAKLASTQASLSDVLEAQATPVPVTFAVPPPAPRTRSKSTTDSGNPQDSDTGSTSTGSTGTGSTNKRKRSRSTN